MNRALKLATAPGVSARVPHDYLLSPFQIYGIDLEATNIRSDVIHLSLTPFYL